MILHETLKENWKCHKKINWIYKQCHPINYLRMTILFTVELVSLFRFLSRNSSMRSSRLIIIIVVRSHVVFISWYIGCTITYCRLHICSGAYNLCVNVLQVFAKFVRIHGHQVECFFVLFICMLMKITQPLCSDAFVDQWSITHWKWSTHFPPSPKWVDITWSQPKNSSTLASSLAAFAIISVWGTTEQVAAK